MSLLYIVLVALASYLFGSISFSRLAFRLLAPDQPLEDIEVPVPGSDDTYRVTATGASAASMSLGGRAGCAIGILDMLKVALPTYVVRAWFPGQPYFLLAAVAAMVGHAWPLYYRFKGGRGVSSVYGAMLVIDPLGALAVAVGGLLIGLLILRDFIVAYLAGLWLLIPYLWWRTRDPTYVLFAVALNAVFILAMIPDWRQYMKYKAQGKVDMEVVMGTTPMGRGMMRMMEKLGLNKK